MIHRKRLEKQKSPKSRPVVSGIPALLITSQLVYFFSSYSEMPITPNKKALAINARACVRRERDSNPRYGFPYTRFPVVLLQPNSDISPSERPIISITHENTIVKIKKCPKNHLANLPAICQRPPQALGRHPLIQQKVLPRPRPAPFCQEPSPLYIHTDTGISRHYKCRYFSR